MKFEKFPYKDLYPFESHYCNVGGYKMHYVDEGQGPLVILVHGNPTWSFYYREVIKKLRTQFRVIAPDHIGCGLSEHPYGRHFKAADRVTHLQNLVDSLGLKSFSLIMHDWGGSIGTTLAVRNLERIDRLIYLNTTLTETESLPWFIKISSKPFIGKFLTKTTKTFLRLTTNVGAATKLPKRVKKGYFFPYRTAKDRSFVWDFVHDIPFNMDHPTYSGMMEISRGVPELSKKPIQIIWGLKDPCFHQEILTQLMRLFPAARVLEIPTASHLVVEDATDLVNETIENFLTAQIELPSQNAPIALDPKEIANTLYGRFVLEASKRPFQDAAIVPSVWGNNISYHHINYSDIKSLVARYHRGLCTLGLRSGDKVLFLVKPGIDFLALAFAVMAEGAVPIFIDPGIDRKYLIQALGDIKADVFIGTQKAHFLRILKKDLFSSLRFHVIANEWGVTGGPTLSVLKRFASTPELPAKYSNIGMVAFTSGATGVPKGVIFTQEMLIAQLFVFREEFGILPGGKDLPLLPMFSLFQLANGVTSVFPPLDPSEPLALDPSKVVRIIKDLSISYSFGSPTLWRKIAEYCQRIRITLPTMRGVFMAGAAVPPSVVKIVKEATSNGDVFTPYGATEALPVTKAPADDLLRDAPKEARSGEKGAYVGKPIIGIKLRIIAEESGAIPEISSVKYLSPYEIGEIIVSGPTVSPAYLNRPDADAIGKIKDGQGFWHRMGDMGYLDEAGGLYYCGRKSHIVRSEGRDFHSVPIEELFNMHPRVARSALVSVAGNPAIVIEPISSCWPEKEEDARQFKDELKFIASSNEICKNINKFFFHPSFPVDRRHNAKIYRDKLGEWALSIDKASRRIIHAG